ncbi:MULTISPECIES: type IVB secretion system protein IcmH/DotU [unclassified Pseudomonas]|jgi:type VI secretion system protein ImpK|uniref:type IVB secretion system protein IcmH/DotU n=1 Tax=unclassified Pseudomonas TaxID=196821 RepID=UPI000C1584D8|nr:MULTISPECIES: type IVB secretion system protein IcmH/DotU [unclassified Pseudomonas]MCF5232487.1 DotU family type IV/VI secretion system protein [Pseudomonas sp. PA-5-4H]MCF5238195.1 DotU family type IV/VI secretion system protein [Pseudomonas sp. PA-5-4G]MCF5250082.1 DotU family type IV/VI secretion system protein [Pseudomonas sp. PA-5-4B]MCF5254081.1 DotU family type IV/VI secretion system protein [Pseudomonas sp. PA-5-4B]MCF5261034.1 DotU family type IV/VI secretion system protein [Pseud
MNMDSDYPLDEKTVLLDRNGHGPVQRPVTDFPSPPRFEQLEDRMVYAAAVQGAQRFNVGLNPLVTAAWELMCEVLELKLSSGRENLQTLNERLAASLTRFEVRAQHEGMESAQVIAARYVLCSVVDEAVVTTAWGSRSDWSKISLLSRFHNETFGGEKFFQLLERLSRDPVKHLAMLELMYLCLSMGFEGKYRVMERGVTELEGVRDALYRQIRHVRGDPVSVSASVPRPEPARRKRLRTLSATWCVALGLIALLAMYSATAWVLEQERAHALQSFQSSAPELTPTPL